MNIVITIAISALLVNIVIGANTTIKDSITKPPEQNAITENQPTPTTTVRSKVHIIDRPICKRCHCDINSRVLDCSHKNFTTIFAKDEMDDLINSDAEFETIHLDNNNLQSVPRFGPLPVKKLYLNNNYIKSIEKAAFKELSNLELLDLSNNKLTSEGLMPIVFEGKYDPTQYEPLGHLEELNLGYNQLHMLNEDLFEHFPALQILNLASNPFHIINHQTEVALSTLLHLKNLDLSYMELSDLPAHIFHTPRELEKLSLCGNLFSKVPEALEFAKNLKDLNLDENLFKELDDKNGFPQLKELEVLSISYMPELFKIGAGAFSKLIKLKEFFATNNPLLSSIDSSAFSRQRKNTTVFDYPPIEKLYIHNNNLTVLDKTLLERWDLVKVADIRYNPWKCDCDNSWLIHSLFPDIVSTTPVLSIDVHCAAPKEWKDVPFTEIHNKKKNLRCSDIYGNQPSKDGAILLGILIGLLVGIPMTLASVILYKRGCFGLIAMTGPGAYNRAFYKRANFAEEF